MTNAYAKLIMVAATANNNKYYEMEENGDGTFTGKWGRVGRNPQKKVYPMRKWDAIFNQKVKKGYRDVTHTVAVESSSTSSGEKIVSDSRIVKDIFNFLLSSTSQSVNKNYLVPVQGVTQAMIDDAQGLINDLVFISGGGDWTQFNQVLQQLFAVIPRKMDKVADYLLTDYDDDEEETVRAAHDLIVIEEDTLDSLRGQVVVSAVDDPEEQQDSLFNRLGIAVEDVDPTDRQVIIHNLGDIKNQFQSAVKITNEKTRARYTEWLESQKHIDQQLLWHGSRTQNWISLLQKGLLIRPSGVVHTGSMFGDGIYFAPRARKSLGYTSLDGSYWVGGYDSRGYMGLFEVHVGKMAKFRSAQYNLNFKKIRNMGCDSAMGERGYSLYNDEIIVYNVAQTNIKYLVELR